MTTSVRIDDAPSIVAASICYLTRWAESSHSPTHPTRCGWCDFPPAELLAAISGFDFEGWAAREFRGLPAFMQERLVREAQELEPEPEPMPATPAVPVDEEAVPWL